MSSHVISIIVIIGLFTYDLSYKISLDIRLHCFMKKNSVTKPGAALPLMDPLPTLQNRGNSSQGLETGCKPVLFTLFFDGIRYESTKNQILTCGPVCWSKYTTDGLRDRAMEIVCVCLRESERFCVMCAGERD